MMETNINLTKFAEIEVTNAKANLNLKKLLKLEGQIGKTIQNITQRGFGLSGDEVIEIIDGLAEQIGYKKVEGAYLRLTTDSAGDNYMTFKYRLDSISALIYVKD